MSDISAATTGFESSSFDPAALEARLSAPTGDQSPETENGELDLLQELLADESLTYLESRRVDSQTQSHLIVQLFRVAVLPHQSRLVIHCAFRPDLPSLPNIEAEVIDRDARIRVTHKTTFGARIEVTLSDSQPSPSQVCVEVISTSESNLDT